MAFNKIKKLKFILTHPLRVMLFLGRKGGILDVSNQRIFIFMQNDN